MRESVYQGGSRGRAALTVVVTVLVALSMVAGPVGASLASGTTTEKVLEVNSVEKQDPSQVQISPALKEANGTRQVVVRLTEAGPSVRSARSERAAKRSIQRHAERTRQSLLRFAEKRDGVSVLQTFWITNAVLLEVDTSKVRLAAIARVEHVERLHGNVETKIEEPERSRTPATTGTVTSNGYNTTYGLDQVNATEVWSTYGTMGDGVKVAVLDTGVDVNHSDIQLFTRNASNDTYPGGWAEFNSTGARVTGSTPHDTDQHGTHTSGTVSGGNASGEYIGVAPEVELMHALVAPSGYSNFAQVVAGMEWAVNNGADVISMSLGFSKDLQWKSAVENALAAGTVTVVSAGNSGDGTSGSPGNMYESITVGASNSNYDITSFSSGEKINSSDFSGTYPSEWPSSFIVPDVAAPGKSVKSSVPGDSYSKFDGTSMAAPHVAGTIALMIAAAGGNLSVGKIKEGLYQTAWKPAGEPSGNDTRYGAGLVDAKAAVDFVAVDAGVNGTVTNASGDAIEGALVETDDGFSERTDANGDYSVYSSNGTTTVTADAFGYASRSTTVTVPPGGYASANFSLSPALEGGQTGATPESVVGGDAITAAWRVANADNVTITASGDFDASDATLYVDGTSRSFGTPVSLSGRVNDVDVRVETANGSAGNLTLTATFEGEGSTLTDSTTSTRVYESVTRVAVLDTPGGAFGSAVASTVEDELPPSFQATVETNATILANLSRYSVVVVQKMPLSDDQFVDDFVNATETDEVGVVYLDQWSSDSNGITRRSSVVGDPVTVSTNYGNTNESFLITEDHPIFDGVGTVGDEVPIHNGGYGDIAWYTGFDGNDIADVHNGTAVTGRGIGINESTNTVMLASIGRQDYATDSDFTAAADAILGNAVEYVVPAPANPTVEGAVLEADGDPAAGDNVNVLNEANFSDQRNDRTAANGAFDVTVDGNSTYGFTYHQFDEANTSFSDDDGTADVYSFEYTFLKGNTSVGNHTIPTGHDVNITVVNESGVAVPNATVTIWSKARSRAATFGVNTVTNADGMVDPNPTDPPGIELAGNVTVDVSPPKGNASFNDTTIRNSLTVTGDRSLTVTLVENDTDADLTGNVSEADGDSAAGDEVHVVSTTSAADSDTATTGTDGSFRASVAGQDTYTFTFQQFDESNGRFSDRDGTADVYAFATTQVNGTTDLGSFAMPAGHVVNVTVVDEGGDPVEDAEVTVLSKRSTTAATVGWTGATGPDGELDPNPADPAGLELSGNVTINVAPPDGSTRFGSGKVRKSLTVTSNRSLTVTLNESGPAGLTARWAFDTGARLQHARVATGDRLVFAAGLGETVHALYRANGSVAWSFDRAGSLADSSPLVANDTVYVGSGGGVVYALNASTGATVWNHTTDSAVVSSPAVANGTVFVGSNDGTVLAVDAATGSLQWTHEAGDAVYSTPATGNGTVVVTTDGGSVLALDATTGSQQWSLATNSALGHAGATVENGTALVAAEQVYAVDLATGTVTWKTPYGGTAGASPAVGHGMVYVGADNGTVTALDATTGAVQWQFAADAPVAAAPVVGQQRVVVATMNGTVSVLNASTGRLVNETWMGSAVRTPLSLAGDNAYLGTRNGSVVAVANAADAPVTSSDSTSSTETTTSSTRDSTASTDQSATQDTTSGTEQTTATSDGTTSADSTGSAASGTADADSEGTGPTATSTPTAEGASTDGEADGRTTASTDGRTTTTPGGSTATAGGVDDERTTTNSGDATATGDRPETGTADSPDAGPSTGITQAAASTVSGFGILPPGVMVVLALLGGLGSLRLASRRRGH